MVMRGKGIQVLARAVDVADEAQMENLFAEMDAKFPPLRGVFHGAMVLDDGLIAGLSPERFERVMAPKVVGAWILHRHCMGRPLDFFLMLSSISSLVGNVGQANYAAANAFLDSFAHYRKALGLPPMTVNWGALADVGVAARNQALEHMLASAGVRSLPVAQALAAVERLLERCPAQMGVFDLDWQKWTAVAPHLAGLPIFKQVIAARSNTQSGRVLSPVMRLRCKLALLEHHERQDYLQSFLAEILAQCCESRFRRSAPRTRFRTWGWIR